VWIGLGLILLIWFSTLLLQIPAHQRLLEGFDAITYKRLVSSNWIRTVAWSARGLILGYYLYLGLERIK
jgi:hypothetical protein